MIVRLEHIHLKIQFNRNCVMPAVSPISEIAAYTVTFPRLTLSINLAQYLNGFVEAVHINITNHQINSINKIISLQINLAYKI